MTNPNDPASPDTEVMNIKELQDGTRVRLYPSAQNPIHNTPMLATYSAGYFYCDSFGDEP